MLLKTGSCKKSIQTSDGWMTRLKLSYLGYIMQRPHSLEKSAMLGKMERKEKRRMASSRWMETFIAVMGVRRPEGPGLGQMLLEKVHLYGQ